MAELSTERPVPYKSIRWKNIATIHAGPVTLGDLIREDKLLSVYCSDCYHERDVRVPVPPETALHKVGNT